MKRPLAYITAAWCGIPEVDTDLAVEFCRAAYEAGLAPICPKLYLPLILNDNVPEEHKDGTLHDRHLCEGHLLDFFQGLKYFPLPGEIGGYRYPIFLAPLAYRQPAAPAGLHTSAPFRQPVLLISSL